MKKILFSLLAALATMPLLVSCDDFKIDDNGDRPPQGPSSYGAYVLNSGMMDSNNSELTYFDMLTGAVSANVFSKSNGKGLGDSANDMLVYGSKMYIAVTGSAVVFVTDLSGKIVKEIALQGETSKLAPRQLAADAGKVYVSYREGYIGAIDTVSLEVRKAQVGPYPEGMACVGNKLYVAITDANNYPNLANKVQVLDKSSLQVIKEIEVGYNPQAFHKVSNGAMYLVCWGDYAANPAVLQKINTSTDEVITIEGVEPTSMTVADEGIIYILSTGYDENWNQQIKYYKYNSDKERIEDEFISSDLVPDGYCIKWDPVSKYIFIGTSDYISNGDVYVLTQEGRVLHKFDTGALNPYKICFVSK